MILIHLPENQDPLPAQNKESGDIRIEILGEEEKENLDPLSPGHKNYKIESRLPDTPLSLKEKHSTINSEKTLDLEAKRSGGCPDMFSKKFDCGICFQNVNIVRLMPLACHHIICRDCFHRYLEQLIAEKRVKKIMCPQEDCKNEIKEEFIMGLSVELGRSYLYARQFISPDLRRCVGKDCENFLPGSNENPHLKCECGGEVCYFCGGGWHSELTCQEALEQDLKEDEKKDTIKLCPQCKIRIYKLGGCDHITCCVCAHEWCWICKSPSERGHETTCQHYGEHIAVPNLRIRRRNGGILSFLCKSLMILLQIIIGLIIVAIFPIFLTVLVLGWPAFWYFRSRDYNPSETVWSKFFGLFLVGLIILPITLLILLSGLIVLIIVWLIELGGSMASRIQCLQTWRVMVL